MQPSRGWHGVLTHPLNKRLVPICKEIATVAPQLLVDLAGEINTLYSSF